MKLSYTPEQEQLRDTMGEFLAEVAEEKLWPGLAEFGALGLVVPEQLGGEGAGLVELGLVAQATGSSLRSAPLVPSAVLATLLLTELRDEHVDELLRALAKGERTATASWSLVGAPQSTSLPTLAGDRLSGTLRNVPWAGAPGAVLCGSADGSVVCFDPSESGVNVENVTAFDETEPLVDLVVDDVMCFMVVGRDQASTIIESARARVQAVIAMELVGVGRAVLNMAVEYAKVRTQFGRPIGSFQAIKHMLADAHLTLDAASALAHLACVEMDSGASAGPLTARLALASASRAARLSTLNSMQSFGGVGYTWEQGSHRYLRRVLARGAQLGSQDDQLREIAGAVLPAS
jgi:alkylation response protein AidB-like acyl-CoA dehydrogenase